MVEIINVNESDFQKEVLEYQGTTLVYFWAEWCGPCKVMGPNVEEFAKKTTDVKVVKINVDENQQLSQSYNVMSVPTTFVFKEGKVTNQVIGSQTPDQLNTLTT